MWFRYLLLTVCLVDWGTFAVPSPRCRTQKGTFAPGEEIPSKDPCSTCHCVVEDSKPQILCASMECAPCKGGLEDDGSCCGKCVEGCKINETVYAIGDDVPQGPCKECTCVAERGDPQLICAIYDCHCLGRVTPDDTCCGICEPGCFHEGRFYHDGEKFSTKNPCVTGQCQNGAVEIMEMACEYCKGQWKDDGSCCGKCEPGCLVDGKLYSEGEDIPTKDPCSFPMCENGEPVYILMSCPFCPGIHTPDNSCCGQCIIIGPTLGGPLAPTTPAPKCNPNSECPKLSCPKSKQFQSDDMCCPQCFCRKNGNRGKKFMPGPVGDKCDGCACDANTGNVICNQPYCPANVECVDPVQGEDCCFHCPNGRRNCRLPGKKRVVLEYGAFYRTKRSICTCSGKPWYPLAFCADVGLKKRQFKSIIPYFPQYILELGKSNK